MATKQHSRSTAGGRDRTAARRDGRSPRNDRTTRPRDEKPKYWSGEVTKHSNALDLEEGVFTWKDPARIAASLKRSAEESTRRKATPYQSAMSMLTFYINRAGKGHIAPEQKKVLERAKDELRRLYGRDQRSEGDRERRLPDC